MARYVLRRFGLMLLTLLVISILVFALSTVLPGDVGRTILGPYASNAQVAALDRRLGYTQPLPVQYVHWLRSFVTGQWGDSVLLQVPIVPLVLGRLWNSFQLALVALVIIVPFSVSMGVIAGLREDGLIDRTITTVGLSLTAIPEFVSGVILLVVFGIKVKLFPITALSPPGSSFWTHLHYLILPAFPLMFVLFGYVARMARAGTREVKESAYYRSAVLKGLTQRRVVLRHVLPNALVPTITVVAVQSGFLVGGLVVIETLFNYPGIGSLELSSALGHDIPVLEYTTVILGAIIAVANLVADLSYALLNPKIRLGAKVA